MLMSCKIELCLVFFLQLPERCFALFQAARPLLIAHAKIG